MDTEEHVFSCPYCGDQISMVLDLSIPEQEYIEDCETCCNPIAVLYSVEGGEIVAFDARSIEQ